MSAALGHTIQKIINNTPVSICVNETTTVVNTNGGNVFQAGLIKNKIQEYFKEVISNENIVGRVIDVECSETCIYFLNDAGSVFCYEFNAHKSCDPVVKEIYSPFACKGDKAIKIASGRDHVLILTEHNHVFGSGDNSQYQLVPQGQCRYDIAVEIIVTDTLIHDNTDCHKFVGHLNQLEKPKIPVCPVDPCPQKNPYGKICVPKPAKKSPCGEVTCIKRRHEHELVGLLTVDGVNSGQTVDLEVFGDIEYTGFLCVDCDNIASGSLTYEIKNLKLKGGCQEALLGSTPIKVSICDVGQTTDPQPSSPCGDHLLSNEVIKNTCIISGHCGENVTIQVTQPTQSHTITSSDCGFLVGPNGSGNYAQVTPLTGVLTLDSSPLTSTITLENFNVELDCCKKKVECCVDPVLPQPCWTNVFAGFDTSVLVDNCNRLYVLGSIHQIRNNDELLKRSCLEDLLNKTNASISFPADQLNCCVRPRNETCKCVKCRDNCFETDLSKFGVHLSFPNDDYDCDNDYAKDHCGKVTNVCDFLKALQSCNASPLCDSTCEPCDPNIYLDVLGDCDCHCGKDHGLTVGSIVLYNKRSVCRVVSYNPKSIEVCVTLDSIIEFDYNRYCIDGVEYALDNIITLKLSNEVGAPQVCLYLDIDCPGGILFNNKQLKPGKRDKPNVCFAVKPSGIKPQDHDLHGSELKLALNFGSIMDPVELTNFKQALCLDPFYPCPRYKNPFNTKLINTYVKGGDKVKFVLEPHKEECGEKLIKQMVTADVPTVFRLGRRILDVGVGWNNLSVLIGNLACPNEICAIGNNCSGQLGLNSNETAVCWQQVNRCLFDCQVNAIFAGKYVTFYITQSDRVFGSGQWKCLVDSNVPVCIKSFCQSWKIKEIAVAQTHIVLLGHDGCVYGLGDNSLGELGLCHVECVPKPVILSFFYWRNEYAAQDLHGLYQHPVERNYHGKCDITPPCKPVCDVNPCKPYEYKEPHYKESCYKPSCEVKYFRNPGRLGVKKYIPNARCCVLDKYGKY